MDVDEEVTSTLKRKIGNPPQNRGSNKYLAPTTWAMGIGVVAVLYISPKKFIYFLKHPEDPYFRAFR